MEISGKIVACLAERSGISQTGKPWRCAQYVMETFDPNPKKIAFDVLGEERIAELNIRQGEDLTVSLDLDAREYHGRWYNQLRAWKVVRSSGVTMGQGGAYTPFAAPSYAAGQPLHGVDTLDEENELTDLPF